MPDGNGPLDTASIGEQVTERLRSEIISGRLAPGSRLMLDQYKAQWNISITPLRDAAKRLEADGLVHIYPRRGIFVAEIDRNALMEVFQLRIALEPLVTELATPHAPEAEVEAMTEAYIAAGRPAPEAERQARLQEVDEVIHDFVLAHCPNQRLARIMATLRDSVAWCRNAVIEKVPNAFDPSLDEHVAICKAMRARDAEGAAAAMRDHLIATRDRTLKAMEAQERV